MSQSFFNKSPSSNLNKYSTFLMSTLKINLTAEIFLVNIFFDQKKKTCQREILSFDFPF